jgi:Zn-dependent protease with chaperone function
MDRQKLVGLRPQVYEHPHDQRALDALKNTAGLETVVRKLNEWGFERLLKVQLTGSHLRVHADNHPALHQQVQTACDLLDLPLRPDVYIAAGGDINAFTAGVERPLLVLQAGAVDLLTDDELFFVIAHELGHIKSGHVLYYQIAEFLPVIVEILGAATFGIGDVLSAGLQIALMNWKRKSEFTADRAGLLGVQDAGAALSTLTKLAGLPQKYYPSINTEDFIAQARAFEALDSDKLSWLAKWLSSAGQTHPWTVLRANQLLAWIDSGGYEQVLRSPREVSVQLPPGVKSFCNQCGRPLLGAEAFCPGCGHQLQPPVAGSAP